MERIWHKILYFNLSLIIGQLYFAATSLLVIFYLFVSTLSVIIFVCLSVLLQYYNYEAEKYLKGFSPYLLMVMFFVLFMQESAYL